MRAGRVRLWQAVVATVAVIVLVGTGCQAPWYQAEPGSGSMSTPREVPQSTASPPVTTPPVTTPPVTTPPVTNTPANRATVPPTSPVVTPPATAPATPPLRPGPAIMKVGSRSEQVRDLQARLAQLDWYDGLVTGRYDEPTAQAVSGFQAKRGFPATGAVDQRTWDRLVSMSQTPTQRELYPEQGEEATTSLDVRCLTGMVICVSKADRTVRWVINGTVQLVLDARFGGPSTPTREGTFTVYRKDRDHWSARYESPMPFSLFFSGGQAIHYSEDFAQYGYQHTSHGCVNTRDWDAMRRLYDEAAVGTRVVVS